MSQLPFSTVRNAATRIPSTLREGLTTTNHAIHAHNLELGVLNDDLINLVASIEIPLIMLDQELRIRRFTPSSAEVVHITPSDIGRPLCDLALNFDIHDLSQIATTVLQTGVAVEREVRRTGGRWYCMLIRPYRTASRQIDGLVIVFQDIDARKRSAQEIEDARQYAAAIVETVREPLLVLDGTLRVHTANRAFYDTFHTHATDTIARSFFEIGNGQWNIPQLRALLANVLLHETSFDHFEVVHTFPVINRKTMLLNARRLTVDKDDAFFVLLAIEDITTRRAVALEHILLHQETTQARDAAETANRVKSEFLATMSHELRTPLNAILGYAQLLQMELRGPITVEQRTDLQRIEYNQRHLNHLISGILDFAKIGAGHMAFAMADVPVDQILSETDAMIMAQIVHKGIHYHYQPCGTNCTVVADVYKLQQIVVNLLSNAIKFTQPDGTVTLAYETNDTHVTIRVTDTGVGIQNNQLETIFEPFTQLDNTLTRSADGTGLGLSISRELARGMGGDIHATSVIGEGSTFTITLLKSVNPKHVTE